MSPIADSPGPASPSTEIAQAEARVEAHSAALRKELGVRDLVLTQILFIVGLAWIGVAGKLGPSHVVLWLLAITLFYLPSAAVVIYLNRMMPLEGGLYQWAKLGFNEAVGFMLAWNLWLYVIVNTSEVGLQSATYLSYALGPGAAWMTKSTWFVVVARSQRAHRPSARVSSLPHERPRVFALQPEHPRQARLRRAGRVRVRW